MRRPAVPHRCRRGGQRRAEHFPVRADADEEREPRADFVGFGEHGSTLCHHAWAYGVHCRAARRVQETKTPHGGSPRESLFASGRTTGVVLSIGESSASAVGFYEGEAMLAPKANRERLMQILFETFDKASILPDVIIDPNIGEDELPDAAIHETLNADVV